MQNINFFPLYFYRFTLQLATDLKTVNDIQVENFSKLIAYCNVNEEDYFSQFLLLILKKCFDNNSVPCIIVFRYWEILKRISNKNLLISSDNCNLIDNNEEIQNSNFDEENLIIYTLPNSLNQLQTENQQKLIMDDDFECNYEQEVGDDYDIGINAEITTNSKSSNIYIYQENEDNDLKNLDNAINFSTKYY